MFSFSSSRLLSSYLLMSSIYLCLTFCFICKVSAAPSAKSWGLTILTTLPCVLHLFRCPKLFSASYSSRVFTPSIAFFQAFLQIPALLRPSLLHVQALTLSPHFTVFTTLLLNFWCFCHTRGTASATFGGSHPLLSLWTDGILIFLKPNILYSVEGTPICPDLSKN